MGQIHKLSNERHKLYAAKWPRRNRDDYQEQVKDLDSKIAMLWDKHRRELAAEKRPILTKQNEVDAVEVRDIAEDYLALVGKRPAQTGYQVKQGQKWQSVQTDALGRAVGRYVAEIPAVLPEDDSVSVPTLKEVLARRGLTLRWEQRTGYSYGRLVQIGI